jgi:uncharacterized membrane protein
MLIEKTTRKILRFDLNSPEDLAEYNRLLANPAVKVIEKQVHEQKESHFEKDFSETSTHHVAYLEVEECSL